MYVQPHSVVGRRCRQVAVLFCVAVVGLIVHVADAGATSGSTVTRGGVRVPLASTRGNRTEGLQAAQRWLSAIRDSSPDLSRHMGVAGQALELRSGVQRGLDRTDENQSYPMPCILAHGCVCDHDTVTENPRDDQFYGTCRSCDTGWTGAFCEQMDVDCFNGGVKGEDGNCECPIYFYGPKCTGLQCPNSHDGEGSYSIKPVDDASQMCEACNGNFDGVNCQLCTSDPACGLYAGEPSVCDHGLAIRGDNKQFQCTLRSKSLESLLADNRNVTALVALNCSSGEQGKPFSASTNGECSMTIHRIEVDDGFRDDFFHCFAKGCTMHMGVAVDSSAEHPPASLVFQVLLQVGTTVLIVLCGAIAALGGLTSIIGPKRMRSIVFSTSLLLCIACVAYVFLIMVTMYSRQEPLKAAATYTCETTHCECGEDPPEKYKPYCSATLANTVFPYLTNGLSLTCMTDTRLCHLSLVDLPIPIDVECRASECVNTVSFPGLPNESPGGNAASSSGPMSMLITMFFVAVLVVAMAAVRVTQLRSRSRRMANEFVDIFLLSVTLDAAAAHGPGSGAPPMEGGSIQQRDAVGDESSVIFSTRNLSEAGSPSTEDVYDGDAEDSKLIDTRRVVSRTPEQVEAIHRTRELSKSSFELALYKLGYALQPSRCGHDENGEAGKQILEQVTFSVRSGELLAIMGPSGAGKTTLLDILSARAKQGAITGNMSLNGTSILGSATRMNQYRNLVGYVSQEDTLLPALTAKQTIAYAARLKLPKAFSKATMRNIVQNVIAALKLQRCENTVVGDGSGIRGLSGGEKRRLSIAVELLANPRILFLDEPTSGLDAVSAVRTMEAVAELARDSPMRAYAPHYFAFKPIVIFSIHQPSQEIYRMFDRILLLSKGTTVYCGPASVAVRTLEERMRELSTNPNLHLPNITETSNHAELLMKLEERMSDPMREHLLEMEPPTEDGSYDGTDPLASRESEGARRNHLARQTAPEVPGAEILEGGMAFRRFYANEYEQLALLTSRASNCLLSSFHLIVCHAGVTAIVSALMCFLYKEQDLDLPGALNRAGSITFLLLVVAFVSLSCLEQLILERKVFVVERENGYYTALPYLMSKIFVDILPLRVVPVIVLTSVIYFPMGLRTDDPAHLLWFIAIVVLFSICVTLTTMCVGIFTATFGAAALVSSILILWNFVFGGLLVQAETIPYALRPFKLTSPFFLAFESLLVNELDGQQCTFAPTDERGKPSDISIPIVCAQYLANIGLQASNFSLDVTLLCAYCGALVVLAWALLQYFTSIVR